VAPVDVARLLAEAKLAVRLLESGAVPARLEPGDDVLDVLQVSTADRQQLVRARVDEQVELLRPYVIRFLAEQHQAKAQAATTAAEAIVGQLQQEAQHVGAIVHMPLGLLATLATIPAFKGLRFETVSAPWSFPRAHLGKILHALVGCTNTSARLEAGRLILSYAPRAGGRGQIILLDQAIPDWETDILRVPLTTPTMKPATAAPVPAEHRHVPPRRRHHQPEPPRHWLIDAAYALVDGLLAG
jgi:hypothetical protein